MSAAERRRRADGGIRAGLVSAFGLGLLVGGGAVWMLRPAMGPGTATAVAAVAAAGRREVSGGDGPGAGRARGSGAFQLARGAAGGAVSRADDGAAIGTPEEARAVMAEAVVALGQVPEEGRLQAVGDLIFQLRLCGGAGLEAVGEFLARGDDMRVANGWSITSSELTRAPTLRTALIAALKHWDDPRAETIGAGVVRGSDNLFEVMLAAAELERRTPGTYRGDVIGAVEEVLGGGQEPADASAVRWALSAVAYYQAPELMPSVERVLGRCPYLVGEYVGAIAGLPEADRRMAVRRVIADPQVLAHLAQNPDPLKRVDLADPAVAGAVANLFATQMAPKVREEFLADFGQDFAGGGVQPVLFGKLRSAKVWVSPSAEERQRQRAAKRELLRQLAPFATTPVLRQRVEEAWQALAAGR